VSIPKSIWTVKTQLFASSQAILNNASVLVGFISIQHVECAAAYPHFLLYKLPWLAAARKCLAQNGIVVSVFVSVCPFSVCVCVCVCVCMSCAVVYDSVKLCLCATWVSVHPCEFWHCFLA
jgi:hypothetical protein